VWDCQFIDIGVGLLKYQFNAFINLNILNIAFQEQNAENI
jgi:hypothetical protein